MKKKDQLMWIGLIVFAIIILLILKLPGLIIMIGIAAIAWGYFNGNDNNKGCYGT